MKRIVPVLALGVSACSVLWGPGNDPQGERLRGNAGLVSIAIGQFQEQLGHLPVTLNELVPTYLPQLPAEPELLYAPGDGSLGFSYTPNWPQSGHVSCSVRAGSTQFSCHGYV